MQSITKTLHRLSRQCLHQVNIDVIKSCCPCQTETLQKCFIAMNSSKQLQFCIVGRLQTDTQSVHSKPLQTGKQFFRKRSRITLYSKFDSICSANKERLTNRSDYLLKLLYTQERWCSSTKKYRTDFVLCCHLLIRSNLPAKRFCILFSGRFIRRSRKEIAIMALPDAKRNMNIQF